ncbi:MAG: hypothetical protein ACK5MD_10970 [Flavobacteriales bacterium]
MKKKIFFCIIHLLCIHTTAQVGIGTSNPNPKSLLDIQSKQTGLLVPRMTTTERNALTLNTMHEGMMVYDTEVKDFFYVKNSLWETINTDVVPSFYIHTAFFNRKVAEDNNSGTSIGTSWFTFLDKTYTPKSSVATNTIFFECSSSLETVGGKAYVEVQFVINNKVIRTFKYGGASGSSEDQGSINLLVPYNNQDNSTSLNFQVKFKRTYGAAKVNRVDCIVYERVNLQN